MPYIWTPPCKSCSHLGSAFRKNGSLTRMTKRLTRTFFRMEKPKINPPQTKNKVTSEEFQLFKWRTQSTDIKAASSRSKAQSCKHTAMLANCLVLFSSHLCLSSLAEESAEEQAHVKYSTWQTAIFIFLALQALETSSGVLIGKHDNTTFTSWH